MKEQRDKEQSHGRPTATARNQERRHCGRRKHECEGYAYIEMVGWIDRREIARRDEDSIDR